MTTKRICYTRPDGGVSVIMPNPGYVAKLMAGGMTEKKALAAIQASDVPADAVDVTICEARNIPDRAFRDAWKRDTSPRPAPIAVDMPKARDIHRDRLRAARVAKLAGCDAEWMKAMGQKKQPEADRIEAKRQALRDLPQNPAIESAATPEALVKLWPADLPS